jgi:hypothetical protein
MDAFLTKSLREYQCIPGYITATDHTIAIGESPKPKHTLAAYCRHVEYMRLRQLRRFA